MYRTSVITRFLKFNCSLHFHEKKKVTEEPSIIYFGKIFTILNLKWHKYNWPNLVYSAKGISCTVFLKIIWGDYFSFKCEFKKVSFKGQVTTPDVWTLHLLIKCENSTWEIYALPRTILSAHQRSKSKSKNFFFFRAVCCYSGNSWNQTLPSHMNTMFLLAR